MEFDKNGFEYFEEDDDMLAEDICVAAYLEDHPSETFGVKEWFDTLKRVNENMPQSTLNSLKAGDILIANLQFQQDSRQHKIRPCIFICANRDYALVFQLTTHNPEGTAREDFQYKVTGYTGDSMKRESWINFDHYVVVYKGDISAQTVGKLDRADVEGLIAKMKECKEKHSNLKYNYDRVISYFS